MDQLRVDIKPKGKYSEAFEDVDDFYINDNLNRTNKSFEYQALCPLSEKLLQATSVSNPVAYYQYNSNAKNLRVKNLSLLSNPFKVSVVNSNGETIFEYQDELDPAPAMKDLNIKKIFGPIDSQNLGALGFRLETEFRMTSALVVTNGYNVPVLNPKKKLTANRPTEGAYFLVGKKTSNGALDREWPSYVVNIKDTKKLAEARDILTHKKEKIVIGKIALGHGGYNRDFSDLLKSPYSWHYSEISSFSDLASVTCNGNPEQLEQHLPAWLNETNYACFWSYRLINEISPEEIDK